MLESTGDGCTSYSEVLQLLSEHGPATPGELSLGHYRESRIRVQLLSLTKIDLVRTVTHDRYRLTDAGHEAVTKDEIPDVHQQLSAELNQWESQSELPRITDLQEIDAETLKQFNYERYEDERDKYGLVQQSREKTERRIWNVKDHQLARVLDEFPRYEPLPQQCAHWVRTLSGKHFFPDANHRTAVASLNALLRLNDIEIPTEWPGRHIGRAVLKSKFVRTFVVDIRFDNLWSRDEHYQLWHRHFANLFYGTIENDHHHVPTDRLRQALENARETK